MADIINIYRVRQITLFFRKCFKKKLRMRSSQNIECSFDCVAHSAVLLKPNVANILFSSFYEQKFVQHGSITIAIGCNGLSLFIFEEEWPNYASGPKSAPNTNSFWERRLFNVCVRVFCARNATISLVSVWQLSRFDLNNNNQL